MTPKTEKRYSFGKIKNSFKMPNLLELQLNAFKKFLQLGIKRKERKRIGLHKVLDNTFPITDTKERYLLEYIDYNVGAPRYSGKECQDLGTTYSAPLKVRLRLSKKDEETAQYVQSIESETYFGSLPIMTNRGTFIINGAERVIVTQIHRSPGVFFSSKLHANGTTIFSSKLIPFRGSWLEFETTINDSMQVYIDRRKKFSVSTFLRALGFSTDNDIYNLFDLSKKEKLTKKSFSSLVGEVLFQDCDIINEEEDKPNVIPKGTVLTEEKLNLLYKNNKKNIYIVKPESRIKFNIIYNSIQKDTTSTHEEALFYIYEQLRATEAPDVDTALKHFNRMFFDPKRYDLGDVGRYRIKQKLDVSFSSIIEYIKTLDPETMVELGNDESTAESLPVRKILSILEDQDHKKYKLIADSIKDFYEDAHIVTPMDIVIIIKELLNIKSGKKISDDIDHLGNRRIRTVGEQLENQFGIALSRMSRTIREKMTLSKSEDEISIANLINIKTVSSVLNAFFGTNQLSQFMDQVNPLAEVTHKRRLSALGAGGLSRDRAGFEVRDVHYTHYGRLCPIETPEGPNIGLISSLASYAKVNDMGFIEAPYRKTTPDGHILDEYEYLTADEEDRAVIAQANSPLTKDRKFRDKDAVQCRERGDFLVENYKRITHMDVSPMQVISAAANMIPFLEHDDANRALMGSNMQRQAVPLMFTDSPYVGTGIEEKIARDSQAMVVSDVSGVVLRIDANECVIKVDKKDEKNAEEIKVYDFIKWKRSNNDTCINQVPLVNEGDLVEPGTVIADGAATENGELAIGKNVLVAYMSWKGYNFEDAIILSERMVYDDIFTSVHIKEYEINVKETKRGEEEFTREIPNVSEEATKNLDKVGVVRIGAEVAQGDILVGKVTPKGEVNLTPEDKLLKAIFGEKAGEVKDASLKVPPGDKGIVIDTKLFERKKKGSGRKKNVRKLLKDITDEYNSKSYGLRKQRSKELYELLKDQIIEKDIYSIMNGKRILLISKGMSTKLDTFEDMDVNEVNSLAGWTKDERINDLIQEIIDNYSNKIDRLNVDYQRKRQHILYGDELPPGVLKLAKVYVAKKRKIQVGDKMAGRHGNKGIVSNIVPLEDMPYMENGTSVDIILNPLGVPSRMNPGQIFETNLGWAAKTLDKKVATPVFDGASLEDVRKFLVKAGLPASGKTTLYDGLTGEAFEQQVTVGITYMLKLHHLVEDKMHARSIGPYSLITQQPLGGKAQHGGQRFGEMEVWALEAYGAANILQEMLTFKSDDVRGRTKVYESIVKGLSLPKPGIPESFNVLVKELQGLCLDVTLTN